MSETQVTLLHLELLPWILKTSQPLTPVLFSRTTMQDAESAKRGRGEGEDEASDVEAIVVDEHRPTKSRKRDALLNPSASQHAPTPPVVALPVPPVSLLPGDGLLGGAHRPPDESNEEERQLALTQQG